MPWSGAPVVPLRRTIPALLDISSRGLHVVHRHAWVHPVKRVLRAGRGAVWGDWKAGVAVPTTGALRSGPLLCLLGVHVFVDELCGITNTHCWCEKMREATGQSVDRDNRKNSPSKISAFQDNSRFLQCFAPLGFCLSICKQPECQLGMKYAQGTTRLNNCLSPTKFGLGDVGFDFR